MSATPRGIIVVAALLLVGACENGSSGRTIGLDATGTVAGAVLFDRDGSGLNDAADLPTAGVPVRLMNALAGDTVARTTSRTDGSFAFVDVPVGSYVVVLPAASLGDSLVRIATGVSVLDVRPDDSLFVPTLIGYPTHPASAVRTLPLGTRVVVTGIALHARETYSDTLLHITSASGALRAVRVRPASPTVSAGDSVRLVGRVGTRTGRRVLEDVQPFVVSTAFVPPVASIPSSNVSTALGGTLDASFVRLVNVLVTDTATAGGNLVMIVNDGSGTAAVVLDRAADPAFRAPLPVGVYVPGRRFDIAGVMVPRTTVQWGVRPRSSLDLTPR
jgi:hypothetical protein